MNYSTTLNHTLTPHETYGPLVVDLFAGCGGLSLGFEAQGFKTHGFEMDIDCCKTYQRNLQGACTQVILDRNTELPPASVVVGGPPCQPFSVGGKQMGLEDSRDGFPIFIAAIQRLRPDIWIFENVRGLLYRNKWYLNEIVDSLRGLGYVVEVKLLNAVDFGVPQNRERIVVVGHRGDFVFPLPLRRRVTAGEALEELAAEIPPDAKFLTPNMDAYVAKYEKASFCVRPRDLHLDAPARTLTCRNLAGATGDMHRLRLPDGRRRRLTIREAARLQSFPDWFEFSGTETSCYNQVGNAVAPLFAFHLAGSVRSYLDSTERLSPSEIVYRNLPIQLSLPSLEERRPLNVREFITNRTFTPQLKQLVNEALFILSRLGVPLDDLSSRRLERMAMVFLAVADVKDSSGWMDAQGYDGTRALKSRDIIAYMNTHFGQNISSGSYDDIRRRDLKLSVEAGIIISSAGAPNSARNNPTRAYALNPEYASLIRTFGTPTWEDDVEEFLSDKVTLAERLSGVRDTTLLPVTFSSGKTIEFSPGEHNVLQKAVIEQFLPRFGYNAEVLYVGDAVNRFLHYDKVRLGELQFPELSHGELPDIVAYSEEKNWLYLIEAVHSSGPISPLRLERLKEITALCTPDAVFVTAFLDRGTFRKFAPDIAWETEVWIADAPDHVIHFDGEKFLGPYNRK